jgi:hypothetical protein
MREGVSLYEPGHGRRRAIRASSSCVFFFFFVFFFFMYTYIHTNGVLMSHVLFFEKARFL